MATLSDLLELDGVVVAGEFTADGNCLAWEAKADEVPDDFGEYMDQLVSTSIGDTTAKFCAEVTAIFDKRTTAAYHGRS